MQMAKPNKTRQLVVRLTEEEYQLIVRASEYTSRTVSGWTRLILTRSASKQLEGVPEEPKEQPAPAPEPAKRELPLFLKRALERKAEEQSKQNPSDGS